MLGTQRSKLVKWVTSPSRTNKSEGTICGIQQANAFLEQTSWGCSVCPKRVQWLQLRSQKFSIHGRIPSHQGEVCTHNSPFWGTPASMELFCATGSGQSPKIRHSNESHPHGHDHKWMALPCFPLPGVCEKIILTAVRSANLSSTAAATRALLSASG